MRKISEFGDFCLEHSDAWIVNEYNKLVNGYYDNNINIGPFVPRMTKIIEKILINKNLL